MPTSIVLAQRALLAIRSDCEQHPDAETGGLLAGQKVNGHFVIPFVLPAGARADRSTVHFTPDSPAQQALLDFLHLRFAGRADYVGDWHLHPPGFDRPSRRDLATARTIVNASTWGTPEAVFPIAVTGPNGFRLRAYLLRRGEKHFTEIPIEVVPDADPRMRELLITADLQPGEVNHGLDHRAGDSALRRLARSVAAGLRLRAGSRRPRSGAER